MTVIDDIYQDDKAADPVVPYRASCAGQPEGGFGNTTTAEHLGTALAAIVERLLIVDLDPQGNSFHVLGIDRRKPQAASTL